jgi:hypothetical protein
MGLLRLIELGVTISFAAPAAYIGVRTLVDGNPMGWAFLALAALFLGMNLLVDTPADIIEAKLGRVLGLIAKDPEK